MRVTLCSEPAKGPWGDGALLSFGEAEARIHLRAGHELGAVQRAARKLDDAGIRHVELSGAGWDLERVWHFLMAHRRPRGGQSVSWPELPEADRAELDARRRASDFSRDLVNATAEELGPRELAERAAVFIGKSARPGAVSHRILEGDVLAEAGYMGLHNVGKGASRPPVMLDLDFNPSGNADEPTFACIVAKGITFDSGGYSLKATGYMEAMKADMGGSGVAAGGLGLAIQRGLSRRTRLIICCAENLVSGSAYKLGDIIRYKNGRTVEVMNTDAEGRLVLADGLLHAAEKSPSLLMDCATLTGAAKMAVGNDFHSVFSFDDGLASRLLANAAAEREGFWRLPLMDFHRGMMKSSFADLSNVGSGQYTPGASVAAAFLSHFVENYHSGWVHLDCSATYRKSPTDKWATGCTGVGVRTVARFLCDEAKRGG